MIVVFGKPGCPYTQAARDVLDDTGTPYEYVDVKKDPAAIARLVQHTGGRRCVPVVVDGDKVTVGFGGT